MRIKKISSQHRRDGQAIFECEHCENTVKMGFYDDDNYHKNVIPNLKCGNCGKKSSENYRPLQTKYPKNKII